MEYDLSKLHSHVERRMIRDAAKNFREAVSSEKMAWRGRLLKLNHTLGIFVAWYDVKLRGWKEGDLEPDTIAEWMRENSGGGEGQ